MNSRNIPRDSFLGIYRRTRSSEFSEGSVPRNFPRAPFLGIFRGLRSSEIPDENSEEHFVGTSEDWTIGKSIEISRGSSPSVYSEELSDELVVLGVSSEICFLRIPSEISEEIPRKNEFPRSYFRGFVSSVYRRNNVIPTTYRRFFFLSMSLFSCSDYPFGFGYSIPPNLIPVRVFCYFGSDFSDRIRVRLRVSGKVQINQSSLKMTSYIIKPIHSIYTSFVWFNIYQFCVVQYIQNSDFKF